MSVPTRTDIIVDDLINQSKYTVGLGGLGHIGIGRAAYARGFPTERDVDGLTNRVRLAEAAVLDYDRALQLLIDLNSRGVISLDELRVPINLDLVVAVGMLAAAQLCEIDEKSLRITPGGMDFVRELAR